MSQAHRKIAAAAIAVWVWSVAEDATAAKRRHAAARARRHSTAVSAHRPSARLETAAMPATPKASGPSVLFVTGKRAYLNRGVLDGLAPGQSIPLLRQGRAMGTCVVETAFDHQATCTGAHPRTGDSFHLPSGAVARKRAESNPGLPAVVDEQTLRERAAVLGETRYEKVDFNSSHTFVAHARASLQPQLTLWHTGSDPGGDYSLEELDGALQVYDIGGSGLDFAAAFTAMRWGSRAATGRFRPTSQSQFYLWEAEVTRRHSDAGTVVAIGRMWPWHTPGLMMLDGLQIGRRNRTDTAEGGIYAGMLPSTPSTMLSSDFWAAGAYGTLVQTGSDRGTFRLAREEARVGVWNDPGTKLVTDADLLAQAWLGLWSVAFSGRALVAPSVRSGPSIDRASVDLGARPTASVGANLHLRYIGAPLPSTVTLVGEIPTVRGLLSAFANGFWNVSTGLSLQAFASFNQERDTDQWIGTAGAELRLPRVGDGLSLGGEAETGWLRGGLVYGQLGSRVGERIHLLSRLSLGLSQFQTPTSSPNLAELGGYLHLEGTLATWLRLRAWSLLRVPFLVEGQLTTELYYGVVLGTSLAGAY